MAAPLAGPSRGGGGLLLAAALLLLCLPPAGLSGQEISGTVSEVDGTPILGALVALEDDEGRRHRTTLTNREGGFRLVAPGPGTYRVRVERMGYRPTLSDPFEVDGPHSLDLRVTGDPVALRGVGVVVGDRGCVLDPAQGSLLADLWEQARQAFRRVEVTDDDGAYRFSLRRYERTVEVPTARVLDERWVSSGSSLRSFVSPPAEDLLEGGWVRHADEGGIVYYGPDLNVLLSDTFLGANCFRLDSDEARPGQVGLAFEPVRAGPLPAIRGTLWMDDRTAELAELTFHYTRHLRPEIPGALLELFGGTIEFRALPDGRWVVDRWVLRLPTYRQVGRPVSWVIPDEPELRRRQERIRRIVSRAPGTWREMIEGGRLLFREEGGDLVEIRTPGGAVLPSRDEAALTGTVWDSLQVPRAPLSGATVRLEGTGVEVVTDARGRFRLRLPLEGSYGLSFHHPVLDSLGLPPPEPAPVFLRSGLVEEAELALPSRRTLLALPCAEESSEEGSGILLGVVRDGGHREPIPGAPVSVRPTDEEASLPSFATRAGPDGAFRFCRIPSGAEYRLVAGGAGGEELGRRFRLAEAGRILELDALAGPGLEAGVAAPGGDEPLEVPESLTVRGGRESPRLVQVGFYERRRAGIGSFLDRDQIEGRGAVRAGDLFQSIPRARMIEGQVVFRAFQTLGVLAGQDICPARIFVNGIAWDDGSVNDIRPEEIEGIEAYAGASEVPIRYVSAGSECGVVLVWLRVG